MLSLTWSERGIVKKGEFFMRIAINGFGRIGKTFLRVLLNDSSASRDIEVVAINCGPGNIDTLAYFFTYDTLMGKYPGTVSLQDNYLCIDTKKIVIFAESVPTSTMWKALDIDWVVDCSGKFTHRQDAQKHIDAGAKAVLISAPAHDEDVAIVPGVNDALFNRNKHKIVSLGSCTTNAFMPMLKVLYESSGFSRRVHDHRPCIHQFASVVRFDAMITIQENHAQLP